MKEKLVKEAEMDTFFFSSKAQWCLFLQIFKIIYKSCTNPKVYSRDVKNLFEELTHCRLDSKTYTKSVICIYYMYILFLQSDREKIKKFPLFLEEKIVNERKLINREEKFESWNKFYQMSKIVVAIYNGNPISLTNLPEIDFIHVLDFKRGEIKSITKEEKTEIVSVRNCYVFHYFV